MKSGDLVFCHGNDVIGRAIRFGEWIRWRRGSRWNHVAILGEPSRSRRPGQPDFTLIQALGRGVVEGGLLSDAGSYRIVPLPIGVDPEKVLAFARRQVGRKYGFLTIASIVLTLGSPRFVNVMLPNTWICSAVAAESLRAGGWIHNWPDIYQVTPAQLWDALVPLEAP